LVARREGRRLPRRKRTAERPGALGEPGWLLTQHDRDRDREPDLCRRHRARNSQLRKAAEYEALADSWQQNVESWTATTNGPYSPKPYYLRVTKDAMPNNATSYNLGDNFNRPVDQREIVDKSFLGLVLFGVKQWNDPTVLNSLQVGDETSAYPLKVDTPSGPVWHRFTFDGYGEQADGRDWDLFFDNPARQTRGRLWPLLHALGDAARVDARRVRPAGVVDRRGRADRDPGDRRLQIRARRLLTACRRGASVS
jgi:hypothetical protein